MFELDKTSFAKFLAEQRKEKGYTQKELAEKLFISDKAVSKWERSLSMPDISLLIPLAELLEVSVTELLEGRRLDPSSEMNAGKVEELVKKALTLSEDTQESRQLRKERRRKNAAAFLCCTLSMILEVLAGIWLLMGPLSRPEHPSSFAASLGGLISMLVLGGLSFGFGIYFWFFMKERLPRYYDENKISVYQDGFFNLSLPGISFNNGSWPHMVKALQRWSAVTMVTAPPVCLLPAFLPGLFSAPWLPFCLQMLVLCLYLAGMFVPLYAIDKKYGNPDPSDMAQTAESRIPSARADSTAGSGKTVPGAKQKKTALFIFMAVMLLLMLFVLRICRSAGVAKSGIQMGFVQQYSSQEWSASYRLLNGMVSKTIYPQSGFSVCHIEIETTQGSLSIEMTDSSGNMFFSAGDVPPGAIDVPISGATRIKITGKDHRGGFSVTCTPD